MSQLSFLFSQQRHLLHRCSSADLRQSGPCEGLEVIPGNPNSQIRDTLRSSLNGNRIARSEPAVISVGGVLHLPPAPLPGIFVSVNIQHGRVHMMSDKDRLMTNEELVAAIQSGNDINGNTERLYADNYGLLLKTARKFAAFAEMDDLLQEAFFHVKTAAERYDPDRGATFATYLVSVLERGFRRYCARYGTADVRLVSLNTELEEGCEIIDLLPDPRDEFEELEDLMAAETLRRDLWAVVDQLPDDEAEVIKRRFCRRQQFKEIATATNVNVRTVTNRYQRALRKLTAASVKARIRKYLDDQALCIALRSGTGTFQTTRTSSTERAALWRMEHEKAFGNRL